MGGYDGGEQLPAASAGLSLQGREGGEEEETRKKGKGYVPGGVSVVARMGGFGYLAL